MQAAPINHHIHGSANLKEKTIRGVITESPADHHPTHMAPWLVLTCTASCLHTRPFLMPLAGGARPGFFHLDSVFSQVKSAGSGCCPGLRVWLRSVWRVRRSIARRSGVSCPISPLVYGAPTACPAAPRYPGTLRYSHPVLMVS